MILSKKLFIPAESSTFQYHGYKQLFKIKVTQFIDFCVMYQDSNLDVSLYIKICDAFLEGIQNNKDMYGRCR